MKEFQIKPLSPHSKRYNSTVCGVGINNSNYQVQPVIDGKKIQCPIYTIWHNMIKRCYSKKTQEHRPTYIGCSVSDSWLSFMSFRAWVIDQNYKGKHLDKDILVSGNKIYSEETCIFVSRNINSLLSDRKSNRNGTPAGVVIDKTMKGGRKYVAQCTANGEHVSLGHYHSTEEAHQAYLEFKSIHVVNIAIKQTDPRLKGALIRISGEILRGEYYQ